VSQCPCLPGPAVPSLGRLAGRSALPVLNAPASAPIGNPFARPLVAVSPFYLFILALLGDLRSRRPLGRLDPACQAWGRERERERRTGREVASERAGKTGSLYLAANWFAFVVCEISYRHKRNKQRGEDRVQQEQSRV